MRTTWCPWECSWERVEILLNVHEAGVEVRASDSFLSCHNVGSLEVENGHVSATSNSTIHLLYEYVQHGTRLCISGGVEKIPESYFIIRYIVP